MGLTGKLFLIIVIFFAIMMKCVIDGVRTKNRKKVIISVLTFIAIVLSMYFGLLIFITSM